MLTNATCWSGADLIYAGFSNPEAAMKSTLWAWIHGDNRAFLASMTPAERADLARQWEGKSEAELAAQSKVLSKLYQPATEGVRILEQRNLGPGKAVLDLYFEGDGKRREFELRQFGEEWRVTGLRSIFN